jgi:hypothetical protein
MGKRTRGASGELVAAVRRWLAEREIRDVARRKDLGTEELRVLRRRLAARERQRRRRERLKKERKHG